MKTKLLRFIAALLLLPLLSLTPGCTSKTEDNHVDPSSGNLTADEEKRIALYTAVLKTAFEEGNGGDHFVAVKLDTLDGLSDLGRKQVMIELESLNDDLYDYVYDYEDIKDDPLFFHIGDDGEIMGTKNGTLLYLSDVDYRDNRATLTGVSWFGNLGAVFPKYEAHYVNGEWQLELLSIAIS